MMISYNRLRTCNFSGLHINLRYQTYNKILLFNILQKILFDDWFMMTFSQILIILLFLFPHHILCTDHKTIYIYVHFSPGISYRNKSQTYVLKLCICTMYLLRKIFIRSIFNKNQILVSCHSVYITIMEILRKHFTNSGDNFISIISAKFFIKILQSINVYRKSSQCLQFFRFHMIQICNKTVSVKYSCQIIMITEILLLFLEFMKSDCLRYIRNHRTKQSNITSAPVNSNCCKNCYCILIQL